MSKLTIVATKTHKEQSVYPDTPPERKLAGGDFVKNEGGQVLHIVEGGQKIRFGCKRWGSWIEFVNDNEWVRDELEALEGAKWDEHQDYRQTIDDFLMSTVY